MRTIEIIAYSFIYLFLFAASVRVMIEMVIDIKGIVEGILVILCAIMWAFLLGLGALFIHQLIYNR